MRLILTFLLTLPVSADWKKNLKILNQQMATPGWHQKRNKFKPIQKTRTDHDFIMGKINDQTLEFFANAVLVNMERGRKKMVIVFISPGGFLDSANDIIKVIKNRIKAGWTFECHLLYAYSGGASIFANCNQRFVYANSMWGQHKAGTIGAGECVLACLTEDFRRLQAEAALLKKDLGTYRTTLPDPGLPLKEYIGRDIMDIGLGTKFVNKILRFK